MKKTFFVFIISLIALPSIIQAQCNHYQTQMVESVSAFYETSNSIFDAQVVLNKLLDNCKAGETDLNYDELTDHLKYVKDNLGITESVMEVALSNADMCYCLNGQIQSDELLVKIDEISEKSKSTLKLVKSIKKTTEPTEIEKILAEIEQLLYESYHICDKASEKAINAQNICY